MKHYIVIFMALLLLIGCNESGKVVENRNIEIVKGKIYLRGANTPFSGTVENLPKSHILKNRVDTIGSVLYEIIKYPDPNEKSALLYDHARASLYFPGICTARVKKGLLDGEVNCVDNAARGYKIEAFFVQGNLNKAFKMFLNRNDTLQAKIEMKNNKPVGQANIYYEEGILYSSATYNQQGALHGEIIHYYDEKLIRDRITYSNGKKDGIEEVLFPDGKPYYRKEWSQGKQHGQALHYHHITHHLTSETHWVNGMKQGVERRYNSETGKLRTETYWGTGTENNRTKQWDAEGEEIILEYEESQDGKRTGTFTTQKWEGKIVFTLKEGKLNGPQYQYTADTANEAPRLIRTTNYTMATLEGADSLFDEESQLIEETIFKGDEAISYLKQSWQNGQIHSKEAWVLSASMDSKISQWVKDGVEITHDKQGNLLLETHWNKGVLVKSTTKKWHPESQQLARACHFLPHEEQRVVWDGLEQEWNKEGLLVYEKSWDLGTPISEKRWGDNGTLLSQQQWNQGDLSSKKVWNSSGQLISEVSWDSDKTSPIDPRTADYQKDLFHTSKCGLSPFGENSKPEGFRYIRGNGNRLYSNY